VTIYVDDMRASFRGMVMCHMIADDEAELHAIARRLGLLRAWYQGDHYDISLTKRRAAVGFGAKEITWREAGALMAMLRETGRMGTLKEALAHMEERHKRMRRNIELRTLGLIPAVALTILAAPVSAKAQGVGHVDIFAGAQLMDRTETVGGVKLIDLGGDAMRAGLRAGYGYRWPSNLYLGGELDGWLASGRARAVVNGWTFSVTEQGGVGAYARIGARGATSGTMIYARVGVQNFQTNVGSDTTPAVGIGAEVGLGGSWAIRLDLTYSWAGDGTERYQGDVALQWRF